MYDVLLTFSESLFQDSHINICFSWALTSANKSLIFDPEV